MILFLILYDLIDLIFLTLLTRAGKVKASRPLQLMSELTDTMAGSAAGAASIDGWLRGEGCLVQWGGGESIGIRGDGTIESGLRRWTGRDDGRGGTGGITLLLTPRGSGRNNGFGLVVVGRHYDRAVSMFARGFFFTELCVKVV